MNNKALRPVQHDADLDLLAEITREALSSLDVAGLLQHNAKLLQARFGYDAVLFGVLDGPEIEICAASGGGLAEQLKQRIPWRVLANHGPIADVVHGSCTYCCRSCQHQCDQFGLALSEPMQSCLCVPMSYRGRTVGVIAVLSLRPVEFSETDIAVLQISGAVVAPALDAARLVALERRRVTELQAINEVVRQIGGLSDVAAIATCIAREAQQRFSCQRVGVLLRDGNDLIVQALASEGPCGVATAERWAGEVGVAASALAGARSILARGPFDEQNDRVFSASTQSLLCVPLVTAEQPLGVLQLESDQLDAFAEQQQVVLTTLAQTVVGPLANAEAIRRTRELRESLSRMIVHDLRNPLMVVRMTLAELLQAVPGGGRRDSVVEAQQATEEMLDLVGSLLDVARLDSGSVHPHLHPTVLNEHVEATIRRFARLAQERHVQIQAKLAADVPLIQADHELLRRMLGNLLSNAIKHTPPETRVIFQTQWFACSETDLPQAGLTGASVLITLQDDGPGIPQAYHQKIFDSFGLIESRRAGLDVSTGLGLTVCRYVAQAHGGQIWVESEPGEGATFRVALPV